MNKYVEEYIAKRKDEIAEDARLAKEGEKAGVLEKLHLGEREYHKDFPNEPEDNFPQYDSYRNQYFRYNLGEVSDEDYAELLKYVPAETKPEVESNKKMSGWYTFAIVLMILGCIGGVIVGFSSGDIHTAVVSVLGSLIFFSQIILLCKIEFNTQTK